MSEQAAAAPSPSESPAGAPRKRSFFEGTYDRLLAPMRRWLKADDESQMGIRMAGGVRRERHKQMRLLFVDVGNASRSQVAQALALVAGFHAESAGTFPSLKVAPEAAHVLQEQGIDISGFRPKPLDAERLGAFDRIVVFSNALPRSLRVDRPVEDWNTLDPQGLPLDAYRQMRKDLEGRIKVLARRHGVKPPETIVLTP